MRQTKKIISSYIIPIACLHPTTGVLSVSDPESDVILSLFDVAAAVAVAVVEVAGVAVVMASAVMVPSSVFGNDVMSVDADADVDDGDGEDSVVVVVVSVVVVVVDVVAAVVVVFCTQVPYREGNFPPN